MHRGRIEHDVSEAAGRRPTWLEHRTLFEKERNMAKLWQFLAHIQMPQSDAQ